MAFVTFEELLLDTFVGGIVGGSCFGHDFMRHLLVRNITKKVAKAKRAKISQGTGATSTPITLSRSCQMDDRLQSQVAVTIQEMRRWWSESKM